MRVLYNWLRNKAPGNFHSPHTRRHKQDGSDTDGVSAETRAQIVRGRAALAQASPARRDHEAIACLLELLWHAEEDVRRAAAHALPGGDRHNAHVPHFGHFVGAFLRGISEAPPSQPSPASADERSARVGEVLRAMLSQHVGEIRGLSNMNYSFLSSALYLAVFATCRDTLLTIRRLQIAEAQDELCHLLWNMSQINVQRRLNAQDMVTLTRLAGEALASLPPEQTPAFWRDLTHVSHPRRLAILPALPHIQNREAVPYLLETLDTRHAQPVTILLPLVDCLARLEDARALPLLQILTTSRERTVRGAALAASSAIQRAGHKQPARTLLRATHAQEADEDSETMLRSASVNQHNMEPPRELLRPPTTPTKGT